MYYIVVVLLTWYNYCMRYMEISPSDRTWLYSLGKRFFSRLTSSLNSLNHSNHTTDSQSLTMDEIIGLNVGGYIYTTSRSTLTRYPNSMLGNMFSDRLPSAQDSQGNFIIDRDGKVFRHILNFLRTCTSKLVLPEDFKEFAILSEEAEFYQIRELIAAIMRYIESGIERVKVEIRQYHAATHGAVHRSPDWLIHGNYEILQILACIVHNIQRKVGLSINEPMALQPGDNTFHIQHNLANPSTEITENIFLKLSTLGYKFESKSDGVDSVDEIDRVYVYEQELTKATTYTFVKP